MDKRQTARREDWRCDKGGKKRGEGIQRMTSTRMTECLFEIHLLRISYDCGRWKLQVHDGSHNHRPSDAPQQHALYRKPASDEAEQIKDLSKAGVAPKLL
jgi:hypothetical protein